MLNNIFENKFIAMENKLDALNEKLLNITSGITPASVDLGNFDGGIAIGGSKTTIIDYNKNFEVNMFAGNIVKITLDDIEYYRSVTSNTSTTLTISPLPGDSASATIGSGESEIIIYVVNEGIEGNSYSVEVVESPGTNDNLSTSLIDNILTIYLGKTGDVLDNTKNTSVAVINAIDNVSEFFAIGTGSGGILSVTIEPVEFTGGIEVVRVIEGSEYQIMRKNIISDGENSITVDGNVTTFQTAHDNLNANANLQVSNVDVTIDNPVPTTVSGTVNTQLTGSRGSVIAHRTAITTADKVPIITITAADQPATAGSLTAVAHGIGVAPGNSYGSAGVSALVTVTPTADKSIDVTVPQATNAEYYDIFLSTSTTAPLWVARITETQRATGCAVTAVATVGEGGSAGVVNVQVVGTGIASTTAPFVANNAYVPVGVTAISCAGKTKAYIYVKLSLTDIRISPVLNIAPFLQNNDSESTEWFQSEVQTLSILGGAECQALKQVLVVDVNSARNMVVLVGTITGQDASVNISVELF